MIRTFLALFLLFSTGAPSANLPQLREVLARMDHLLKTHIQAGRSQSSQKRLLAYVQEQSQYFGQNAAFLEQKALVLMQTGDHEGYQKTLLQIPPEQLKDPVNLVNALQAHWPADITRSTTILTRMLKLAPDSLDDWVHNTLAQYIFLIREEAPAADRFLAELSRRVTLEQHPLFAGLMLAHEVSRTPPTTPQALDDVLEKVHRLKGAHADRYRLLILQKLLQQEHKGPQIRAELDALATSLAKRLEGVPKRPDPSRSLNRYLLAFTHHLQARALGLGSEAALPHLRLSAAFSPDLDDRIVSAYFYDRGLLDGMETFVPTYAKALLLKNRTEEALAVMTRGAVENPSLIPGLERIYGLTANTKPFRAYWLEALEQDLPPAPPLTGTTLEGKAFSLENMRGSWVLLDFWGTWCPFCVQELPELEELYQKSLKTSPDPLQRLHLLALSVRDSQEAVQNFMKEKRYHFPTLPAENRLLKAFSIIHFPTKILVTPQGKWLLIANGKWQKDVQALTGLTL